MPKKNEQTCTSESIKIVKNVANVADSGVHVFFFLAFLFLN